MRALMRALERVWSLQKGMLGFSGNAPESIRHITLSGNLLTGMLPG